MVEKRLISIPRNFNEIQKFVTLTADMMFVNGIPFMNTLSRNIIFITSEHAPSCTAAQISSSLTKISKLYAKIGFIFNVVFMDMEL